MISFHSLEVTLTLFMAYIIVITLSGYFRAWVTKAVGDPTSEYAGLLSLNPLDHIDPIGLIFLIFFHFGWGKYVPLNPSFINPPYEKLKLLFAYLSEAFINMIIGFFSIIILVRVFGTSIINLVIPMVLHGDLSLKVLAQYYPEYSSFTLSIGIVLVAIVYIAILLAALNLIANGFRFFVTAYYKDSLEDNFLLILIPTLLIFFVLMHLRIYLVLGISYCAKFIAGTIG